MMGISVIVPIYHGKKYIPVIIKQIENASAMISESVELILVNDAPDEKIDEINSVEIDIRVINSKVNHGIHGARVLGLQCAQGYYVLFLDQDDYIAPNYFDSQVSKVKDADAIVCNAVHNKRLEFISYEDLYSKINMEYIISQKNPIRTPGQVLIRKECVPEIWKSNIIKNNGADDWFLWISMMKAGCRFECNEAVLFEHVINGMNVSFNEFNMMQSEEEVINVIRKNKFLDERELSLLDWFKRNQEANRLKGYDGYVKKTKIYEKWLRCYIHGFSIEESLRNRGINKVAIYGAGELGRLLFDALKDSEIDVWGFIDREAVRIMDNIKIVTPDNMPSEIDGVIIALANNLQEIKQHILEQTEKLVYTLSELLDGEN